MAQIEIEEIIDHLSSEMRRALAAVFEEHAPGVTIDDRQVFRDFKRQVRRKCSTWEQVPDRFVKV